MCLCALLKKAFQQLLKKIRKVLLGEESADMAKQEASWPASEADMEKLEKNQVDMLREAEARKLQPRKIQKKQRCDKDKCERGAWCNFAHSDQDLGRLSLDYARLAKELKGRRYYYCKFSGPGWNRCLREDCKAAHGLTELGTVSLALLKRQEEAEEREKTSGVKTQSREEDKRFAELAREEDKRREDTVRSWQKSQEEEKTFFYADCLGSWKVTVRSWQKDR